MRTRRDRVGVEDLAALLLGHVDALLGKLLAQARLLGLLLLHLLRRAEAARALLVHLGARRDAVC